MGLVRILSNQTECGKSNMAASKPEIHTSQLPGVKTTNFQRLLMGMFPGLGYTARTMRKLPEGRICEDSKMAVFNWK